MHIHYKQWLLSISLLLASQLGLAYSQAELEIFDNEPPIIKDLLERASVLVAKENDTEANWKAANLYCEAARYGSAEGVYRLGILYAFGRGVPANRDYAANLFGIAATHGHFEAQKMLETIEIKTNDTPLCVLEAVAPERAPAHQNSDSQGAQAKDDYVAKNDKLIAECNATKSKKK